MNDAVKPSRAAIEAFHEAYDTSLEINPRETSQAIYDGLVAALAAQGQEPVATIDDRSFSAFSALTAPAQPVDPDEELYEIGVREGYERAVQEIDQLTGGDGEYRYCTDRDPERHTPNAPSMIQRIVDRFETLNLLNNATETGSDEPDDGPFAPSQPAGVPVTLTYTNWRGEAAERTIVPKSVWYGSTDWHPDPQWLLKAIDVEKNAERDFALKDFAAPQPTAEGGWVRVPEKPTPAMAYAAACAHYGKKLVDATGIEGISMTVNGIDYSFPRAFRKFWKGALSALPPAPANGGEQ